MKYELKQGTTVGVQVEKTPIFGDVKGTSFEVLFDFVDKDGNKRENVKAIAYVKSTDGKLDNILIKDGKAKLSRVLIESKTKAYVLVVHEISDIDTHGKYTILHTWCCTPFRISFLSEKATRIIEIVCGLTDVDWCNIVEELKRENDVLKSALTELQNKVNGYELQVATLTENLETLASAHNLLVQEYNKHKEEI